jgi:predicted P-loop ATPase
MTIPKICDEILASAGRLRVARGTHAAKVPSRAINGGNQPAKRTAIEKMALGFPDMTETGKIRNTCNNGRFAIGKMEITCEYNEFHDKLVIGGKPIGQYAGELSDHACLILRKMIEEQYEFDPGREKMFDACIQLCLERRFDPVLAYLDGLRWDGIDRVDKWLTSYLGAADTPLNQAIGRIALVAQVRRARQPGCKFDQIIVMESPEGFLKSTALSILSGAPENFSDQTILGKSDKEQQELLRGVWLYEIADLSGITKAEVDMVKAFASRTHDRARPAYGRARIDVPRRCVIWATTNNAAYLKSQTGNRRFWPFAVGVIDVGALKRDRDQLLAEACELDRIGASIVLPRELWNEAAQEQDQRRETDPWEDVLHDVKGTVIGDERRVMSHDLLEIQIGIPRERQTPQQARRIGDCMRVLGWSGPKQMRVDGQAGKGYWRALRE